MAAQSAVEKAKCLVVDDEEDVGDLVVNVLRKDGFAVDRVLSGEDALEKCRGSEPDVVILDLNLPGMNGHETARELRAFSDAYIVMLSGAGSYDDKLDALTTSVDDYVAKPFERSELLARVNALLRRPRGISESTPENKRVVVNERARVIEVDGTPLTVTGLEFDLFAALAEKMPLPVTKGQLITRGWGTDGAATSHILNVHIHNLRRKLERITPDIVVDSVRGVGFRLLDKTA